MNSRKIFAKAPPIAGSSPRPHDDRCIGICRAETAEPTMDKCYGHRGRADNDCAAGAGRLAPEPRRPTTRAMPGICGEGDLRQHQDPKAGA